jgi:hypothetical protein
MIFADINYCKFIRLCIECFFITEMAFFIVGFHLSILSYIPPESGVRVLDYSGCDLCGFSQTQAIQHWLGESCVVSSVMP